MTAVLSQNNALNKVAKVTEELQIKSYVFFLVDIREKQKVWAAASNKAASD